MGNGNPVSYSDDVNSLHRRPRVSPIHSPSLSVSVTLCPGPALRSEGREILFEKIHGVPRVQELSTGSDHTPVLPFSVRLITDSTCLNSPI